MKKNESKFESLTKFKLSIDSSEKVYGGENSEDTETCTEVCSSRGDCSGDGVEIGTSIEFDNCNDSVFNPIAVPVRSSFSYSSSSSSFSLAV